MAGRLCSIAGRARPPGAPRICVTAQTLPEANASTRVLRKLGFVLKGSVIDPEEGPVWEWSNEKAKIYILSSSCREV
jgi:RimJ/RimL family protein N-acetyltransferase